MRSAARGANPSSAKVAPAGPTSVRVLSSTSRKLAPSGARATNSSDATTKRRTSATVIVAGNSCLRVARVGSRKRTRVRDGSAAATASGSAVAEGPGCWVTTAGAGAAGGSGGGGCGCCCCLLLAAAACCSRRASRASRAALAISWISRCRLASWRSRSACCTALPSSRRVTSAARPVCWASWPRASRLAFIFRWSARIFSRSADLREVLGELLGGLPVGEAPADGEGVTAAAAGDTARQCARSRAVKSAGAMAPSIISSFCPVPALISAVAGVTPTG
mmetsp:Transcript_55/g.104  ORF Transcript_55/g.104 Transcript_55/m.104 type:complete len:278 (+) Transcript_55:529-1362(+)